MPRHQRWLSVIGIVALLVLVTVPAAATSGDGEGVRSAQQAEEIPTDDAGGDGGGGGSEKDGDGGEHADGGGGKGNGDGQDADGRGGGGHGSPISSGADPTGASHKLPQRRSRRKRRPLERARPRNQQILVSILTAWTGAGWMIETQSNDTAIDLWSGTSFHLIGPLLVAATVAHFEAPEVTPTLYSPQRSGHNKALTASVRARHRATPTPHSSGRMSSKCFNQLS